jgi:hypothetical protein
LLSTSTDAITWTTRTGFGSSTVINSLTYGNGIYVAGGYESTSFGVSTFVNTPLIETSEDGVTWTVRNSSFGTTGPLIDSLTYGDGIYLAGTLANNSSAGRLASAFNIFTNAVTFTSIDATVTS